MIFAFSCKEQDQLGKVAVTSAAVNSPSAYAPPTLMTLPTLMTTLVYAVPFTNTDGMVS